jgi:GNAT superfamily N-acetyltransferase
MNSHPSFAEWRRGDYVLSTDPSRLDIDVIHGFLRRSYWASKRPRHLIEKSIANSRVYGIYRGGEQVAFARVVTDYATFAYLADVFVSPGERGKGLGRWLIEVVVSDPDFSAIRRFVLSTLDAHGLYEQFGWMPLAEPGRWMERFNGETA